MQLNSERLKEIRVCVVEAYDTSTKIVSFRKILQGNLSGSLQRCNYIRNDASVLSLEQESSSPPSRK